MGDFFSQDWKECKGYISVDVVKYHLDGSKTCTGEGLHLKKPRTNVKFWINN